MAFNNKYIQCLGVGTKANKMPTTYTYYNSASDDVTSAGYFAWDGFNVGDQIIVVSANYKQSRLYNVSAVSAGVATVVIGDLSSVLAVVADGTTLAITSDVITFDTTAEAFSYALPDGVVGQRIRLVMIVDGGNNAVITPAHLGNGTTLTFADVGDACDLVFLGTDWWVVGINGVAIA